MWLLVLVAAGVGGTLAPSGWGVGEGTVVVEVGGEQLASVPVTVGSGDPVEDGAIALPNGVPVDGEIEVRVRGAESDLGVIAVRIDTADRSETIPVLRVEDGEVVAARRPPASAGVVLALLAAVVVLWVSELVPLHVTGLAIPAVLAVTDVETARAALAPFFDPIIVLFFAGFLMAEAMRRAGLDRVVAARLVGLARGSAVGLYAVLLGSSAFLSMWMSNTAAVAVMLPVALAITAPVANDGYQRAVVLGIAYASTVGGVGSAIGTPANPLAITFLRDAAGRDISFVGWFAFGLPAVALLLPLVGWWVWVRSAVRFGPGELEAVSRAALAAGRAGPLDRAQLEVLGVFTLVASGWLTETWHGIDAGIVALIGALVLMVIGRVETDDLSRISWPTLLTFGGGLALGTSLATSGTADWVVTRLDGLGGLPEPLALLGVAAVTLAVTTVASNTASAAMLIPLAIPLAGVIGVDPVLAVALVAVASSIDFALVIGTPPTMLAYGTGLFTAARIFRMGIFLDLAGVVIVALLVTRVWGFFGLVA